MPGIRATKEQDEDGLLEKHRLDVEEGCKILARLMLLPRRALGQEVSERLLDMDRMKEAMASFQVSPEVFLRRLHLSDSSRIHGELDGFIAFVQEQEARLRIKASHVFGRYATDRFHQALLRVKHSRKQKRFEYPGLSATYRQAAWALEGMAINDVKLDRKRDIESVLRATEADQIGLEVGWGDGEVIPCSLAFRRIHQKPLGFLLRVQVVGPVAKPGQTTLF